MKEALLEVHDICKNFGSTIALNHFSFRIGFGEIHGLIGENGSGKSTVSSIAAGIQKADSGSMRLKGMDWKPESALEAQEGGIGMIVQEAGTIPGLTVAQNMFLGFEKQFKKGPFVNNKSMETKAGEVLKANGLGHIHPGMQAGYLSMQDRKLVELAKVMYHKPDLLIVDETSTALSHSGREILYQVMHDMRKSGKSVLIISHDLAEIMEQCDFLSVLRDGKGIVDIERKDFEENAIKKAMIGREINGNYYRTDTKGYENEVVLRAEQVTGLDSFMNVSLELHKGEILGIGGLSECGMHDLGKALFGAVPVCTGSVELPAKKLAIHNAGNAVEAGIAYISKDRDQESLALNAPIYNNIASTGLKTNRQGRLMSYRKESRYVLDQKELLSIKCRDIHQEVRALSGGNKQKVAFGKWMAGKPDIYIMDCPTRGVDIGVKAAMYQLMQEIKRDGKSILMISEEMPELIGMSDRILIMKDGAVTGEFYRTDTFSESQLIEVMI